MLTMIYLQQTYVTAFGTSISLQHTCTTCVAICHLLCVEHIALSPFLLAASSHVANTETTKLLSASATRSPSGFIGNSWSLEVSKSLNIDGGAAQDVPRKCPSSSFHPSSDESFHASIPSSIHPSILTINPSVLLVKPSINPPLYQSSEPSLYEIVNRDYASNDGW